MILIFFFDDVSRLYMDMLYTYDNTSMYATLMLHNIISFYNANLFRCPQSVAVWNLIDKREKKYVFVEKIE